MNRVAFDNQLPRTTETTWTLLKYTKLNGCRQEFLPPLGNLYITINISRKYVTVINGTAILEELGLIGVPSPIFKSRGRDVFIQKTSKDGAVLTKFRIKFLSTNDHAAFTELISHYVNVHISDDGSSKFCTQQEFICQTASQRLGVRASEGSEKRKRIAEVPFLTLASAENLSSSMAYNVPSSLNQSNEQVVPLGDTFSSTQTTLDETIPYMSQNSFKFSQAVQEPRLLMVDVSVQTDPLMSIEDLFSNSTLLKKRILSRLREPSFRTLMSKSRRLIKECFQEVHAEELRMAQAPVSSTASVSLSATTTDLKTLLEKHGF